jgi:hypothetical protein
LSFGLDVTKDADAGAGTGVTLPADTFAGCGFLAAAGFTAFAGAAALAAFGGFVDFGSSTILAPLEGLAVTATATSVARPEVLAAEGAFSATLGASALFFATAVAGTLAGFFPALAFAGFARGGESATLNDAARNDQASVVSRFTCEIGRAHV